MSSKTFNVIDFLESDELYGQRVVLSAVLVIRGADCFLMPESEQVTTRQRISVFHPGLEWTLDGSVGGWVGGPASYHDAVEIEGLIDAATTRSDVASISNISRLTLFRDGDVYEVDLTDKI